MARYIDADKLTKDVLASWDKDNHKTLEASRVHRQEHHHLMSIIEKQPIANVAPIADTAKKMQEKLKASFCPDANYCGYDVHSAINEKTKELLEEAK